MSSIKNKLRRYISISISVLLISILLLTDLSVDTWISNEFDRSMKNKARLLITLVDEDIDEVDFDFADEFMPEFSGVNDPEYFQFWRDNQVFEKSKTLELFDVSVLPRLKVPLNEFTITDITLPDGRSGRMYFTQFKPQIDHDIRDDFGISIEEFSKNQKPMELAYAISNEALNQILWIVDIIFILSAISAVIAVRMIVARVIESSLLPLYQLNEDLKHINLNSEKGLVYSDELPLELQPIVKGINHFLNENKALYSREKRITSNIAHELKTPISELLNLSSVALKFPHEKQITDNFTSEVLEISERLKNIVNGILALQKSSLKIELKNNHIPIKTYLQKIISRENKLGRTIDLSIDKNIDSIITSEIAVDTILSNLISNALFYSPDDSVISISVTPVIKTNKVNIIISNISTYPYSEQDLNHFFEPLWQKDASRTSAERYGLGLAIVKSYCDNINAELIVDYHNETQCITFSVVI